MSASSLRNLSNIFMDSAVGTDPSSNTSPATIRPSTSFSFAAKTIWCSMCAWSSSSGLSLSFFPICRSETCMNLSLPIIIT